MCACVHVCVHACVHVCVYVCMYVCVCVHAVVDTYMYEIHEENLHTLTNDHSAQTIAFTELALVAVQLVAIVTDLDTLCVGAL